MLEELVSQSVRPYAGGIYQTACILRIPYDVEYGVIYSQAAQAGTVLTGSRHLFAPSQTN